MIFAFFDEILKQTSKPGDAQPVAFDKNACSRAYVTYNLMTAVHWYKLFVYLMKLLETHVWKQAGLGVWRQIRNNAKKLGLTGGRNS